MHVRGFELSFRSKLMQIRNVLEIFWMFVAIFRLRPFFRSIRLILQNEYIVKSIVWSTGKNHRSWTIELLLVEIHLPKDHLDNPIIFWTNLTSEDRLECQICLQLGHSSAIHEATDFKQKRAIVDLLGWESFKEWFYDNEIRQPRAAGGARHVFVWYECANR